MKGQAKKKAKAAASKPVATKRVRRRKVEGPNRVVSVTEFKAKCLAMLDELHVTGGTITVTKRGKPHVEVGLPVPVKKKSLLGSLAHLDWDVDAMLKHKIEWNVVNNPESFV